MSKKTVVTITGIRPDFIRMCFVFKELDKHFNHILIHTGQHFDTQLSEVFFKQLDIRTPDYILDTGKSSKNHFEQLAYLSVEIPKLFEEKNIQPDLILFLDIIRSRRTPPLVLLLQHFRGLCWVIQPLRCSF